MYTFKCYVTLVVIVSCMAPAAMSQVWQKKSAALQTRWAANVQADNVLPEYPRPQMVRPGWTNLNGPWEYAITSKDVSIPIKYDGKILVPYPVESALSRVKKMIFPDELLWYQRTFAKPAAKKGERILLHFGAVDFDATVYINGNEAGRHKGGYQHFSFDITDLLQDGDNQLRVKVLDPTDQGPNPHGKQTLDPKGIMYTPSSGIWQTVWLETVPAAYIQSFTITPDIDKSVLHLTPLLNGGTAGCTIEAVALSGGKVIGKAGGAPGETLTIPVKKARLWSPDDPFLYDLSITVRRDGKTIDAVKSYFGMRKIEVRKDEKGIDRLYLNNKYTYHLGTLDQGYWPDGLYTAPTDNALQFDIAAAKAMGFNTIRKHIKLEPDRWYYHADKLGMLVWQDMVNPGSTTPEGRAQFEQECKENIAQLYNYPSIVTWVLFNEGWGAYDTERLANWIKQQDESRVLNGHTGAAIVSGIVEDTNVVIKKSVNSDMTDVHSYPPPAIPNNMQGKAMVCGEFGGIAVSVEGHLWDDLVAGFGYGDVVSPPQMLMNYSRMIDSLKAFERRGLSGSIYTQPFDVEAEQNGLITYDRAIIKMPVDDIRRQNARLWPSTAKNTAVTKTFSAKVADTSVTAYEVRVNQFLDGKRDSAFLRRLAVLADLKKDQGTADAAAAAYIANIKDKLKTENLRFLQKFIKSSNDEHFKMFLSNRREVEQAIGKASVSQFVKNIISTDVRSIIFDKSKKPDMQRLEKEIPEKFGDEGEEVLWTAQALYYYFANDYDPFIAVKKKIHAKYPDAISLFDMNNDAWLIFENISNKDHLETALAWSKRVIDKEPTANYYDTYANLLYKLGRRDEAIKMQEKGLTLAEGNGPIAEVKKNLDKMKSGQPTWPQ